MEVFVPIFKEGPFRFEPVLVAQLNSSTSFTLSRNLTAVDGPFYSHGLPL